MKATQPQRVLLAVLLFGLAMVGMADSARGLVRLGNKAYEAGRYDEAMEAYEQADVESPESPVVTFNQGAVHYRAADYAAARESFEKAAKASRDPAFEASCRYNVGDTWFKEARRQMDSDLQKAVEACERSVDSYQAAIALQPEFGAAQRNIEIVRRLWKSILDEQKRRQEQQKAEQEEQQKFAEEMKQLIERQEKAAEHSAALAQKQEAEGASEAVQDQSTAQAKEQRHLGDDTQAAADKLTQMLSQAQPPQPGAPPAAPPPSSPAQEQMNQARQFQDHAADELEQTQPKPASADQKQAAEALRKALESLSKPPEGQDQKQQGQGQEGEKQDEQKQDGQGQEGEKQQDQKQDQQGEEQQQQQGQDGQTPDAQKQQAAAKAGTEGQDPKDGTQAKARLADQDARDILDDEKRNRDRRTAGEQQGVAPVDKDW